MRPIWDPGLLIMQSTMTQGTVHTPQLRAMPKSFTETHMFIYTQPVAALCYSGRAEQLGQRQEGHQCLSYCGLGPVPHTVPAALSIFGDQASTMLPHTACLPCGCQLEGEQALQVEFRGCVQDMQGRSPAQRHVSLPCGFRAQDRGLLPTL